MTPQSKALLAHYRPPAFILKSETTDKGTRYIILAEDAHPLWDIHTAPRVAARYARRLRVRSISPLDYLAIKRQAAA